MVFRNVLDLTILAECSFREWESSPFADEFIKKEKGGKFVFSTDKDKLVFDAEYCGYGNHLHKFYIKTPAGRWINKRWDILSDEQLLDSNVFLLAEKNSTEPYCIVFEVNCGAMPDGKYFYLTDEMKRALMEAYEFGYEDYFPNYSVSNFQPFKDSMGASARSSRRTPDTGKEDLILSILKQNSK